MNTNLYKKISLLFCAFVMALSFNARAQSDDNNHFIYIQAKNKQPFYVILNGKVYSSSTIGYLIIPKLQNGTYALRIGFPKQSAPEQKFSCVVNDADVGYSLQKDDEGTLGLLDLQSQKFVGAAGNSSSANVSNNNSSDVAAAPATSAAVQTAATVAQAAAPATQSSSSAFGDMLSSVANDSTLNQKVAAENVQPKAVMQQASAEVEQPQIPASQADSFGKNPQADANAVIAASGENLKVGNATDDDLETYGVIKSSERSSNAGQQMTFVLFNNRSTDTVKIMVPKNAPVNSDEGTSAQTSSPGQSNVKTQTSDSNGTLPLFENTNGDTVLSGNSETTTPKSSKKSRHNKQLDNVDADAGASTDAANAVNNPFYDAASGTPNNNAGQSVNETSEQATSTPCDNPVSDKDLEKLQKKMIRKGNDDAMLSIADDGIKGKCISTQQVKQLGSLFLSDAGRFALYQDAYQNVSDKDNYSSLQNQLLDSYFKKRFLNMLKNPQ